jgi:hypothetical protein
MKKKDCEGCEQDFYNHGGGGSKQCWSFDEAKPLIMRKKVSIDQVPPWNQTANLYPSCYEVKRFIFVKPEQVR